MPTNKGCAPEANRATPAFRGSIMEVGAYRDGFCDPLSTDTAET